MKLIEKLKSTALSVILIIVIAGFAIMEILGLFGAITTPYRRHIEELEEYAEVYAEDLYAAMDEATWYLKDALDMLKEDDLDVDRISDTIIDAIMALENSR